MKKVITVLLLFVHQSLLSQNLVPNGGFETMNRVPDSEDNGTNCADGWFCPIRTVGDYYNRASTSRSADVPNNHFGKQESHSGDAYAGICIENGMVEYLETKLSDTLIKGKSYLIEFYISRADKRSGFVNEFGVTFSGQLENIAEMNGIPEKPPVDFINDEGYKDKEGWIKLSAIYVAEGYETFMLLGHFNYQNLKKRIRRTHYYIDDISITPIEEKEITR